MLKGCNKQKQSVQSVLLVDKNNGHMKELTKLATKLSVKHTLNGDSMN